MTLEEWQKSGKHLDHRGLSVFYHRQGKGETLLCLHGFPASSFDYHKIWSETTQHYDVIAFDMIGYGFSSKPQGWGYTTFDQVEVLQAFLDHLGVRSVHILAHDYGNTITQELLARQAEGRLDLKIASICFLNGALFPETHRPILAQKLLISPIGAALGRLIPDSIFKKNLAKVFGPDSQPTPGELEDFVHLFKFNRGRRIAHQLIRYMTERVRHRERWLTPLQNLKQPFRFVNGLADPVSGEHLMRRFRELIPDQTDIVELPNIGHFPHIECPRRVLEAYSDFRRRIG